MSKAETTEEVFEICLRCGEPNPEGTSRCTMCMAPLDDSASTHPWEMKTANHHAYADAVSPKTKPIVFWGVWVYFGPSAIFAIYLVYQFFASNHDSGITPDPTFEDYALLALPVGYGILSLWALWSVTKGYLGRKSKS